MLKFIGIIAEYNPFHNGHKWHIEKSIEQIGLNKDEAFVVAVMSGSFMQRGEPAIFDKWSRAAMAVESGVDLVIELPFVFSVRSAQYFAQGGVKLLNNLGVIDYISFGAEHDDLFALTTAAEQFDNPETVDILKSEMKSGKTYAAALSMAIKMLTGLNLEFLSSSNNILAIEYLKALKKYDSKITPIAIKRFAANHLDTEIKSEIASAKSIREALLKKDFSKASQALPEHSIDKISDLIAKGFEPLAAKNFETILLALLRNKTLAELIKVPDVTEGLEYKFAETCLQANSFEDLINLLKSKRYLQTRLQRILMHILLNTTKDEIAVFDETGPLYARVLAFNDKGRHALKAIKDNTDFPILVKPSEILDTKERVLKDLPPFKNMLKIDTLATDIYCLGFSNKDLRYGGQDYLRSPIYIKKGL
ncbi:nucleotidyltransferase [Selenomonadales bacterium OttesenSCG-928-I06]|nr:nucleotidyltransferase [Selenomonadales bacterium OttesenSCG-928-I06]